jgi:putative addiction module component (TIGR02574 family)
MTEPLLSKLLKLGPHEPIEVTEDVWARIEPGETPPLTTEQKRETGRRDEAFGRDPGQGPTGDTVKPRRPARYR